MTGSHTLTVLGTADLHGHVRDWDYLRDERYRDAWCNAVGLARVATVVRRERAAGHAPILVDAGDFLQGTRLASYAIERLGAGQPHPMAVAMNAVGFDAAVVGNHEFDFGLDVLRTFERQAAFPLVAANVADQASGGDAFVPYVVRDVDVPLGPPVRVGIIGLAHPGTAVWNRSQVGDVLRFDDLVGSAEHWVPRVRAAGADVVMVAAHAGPTSGGPDGMTHAHDGVERIAEQVPGVDAILAGHVHREVESAVITHEASGEQVVVTMPMCWGMRVSAIDITIRRAGDGYRVVDRQARLIDTAEVEEDPEIVRLVDTAHRAVVDAGRAVVGTLTDPLDGRDARWRPAPLVSLVQHVQAESVASRVGALPVLSVASVPHHAAATRRGVITRRDIEAMAAFDNRVVVVRLSGAGVRAHLETAARYFSTPAGRSAVARRIVNASTPLHPDGAPDFAYDSITGHAAPLRYEIDLAHGPGERIRSLTYAAEPIRDEMEFAVAMSAFRRTGAHGYTEAAGASLLYEGDTGVRDLLTDWIASNSPIAPQSFHHDSWRLTYDGAMLDIVDDEVEP